MNEPVLRTLQGRELMLRQFQSAFYGGKPKERLVEAAFGKQCGLSATAVSERLKEGDGKALFDLCEKFQLSAITIPEYYHLDEDDEERTLQYANATNAHGKISVISSAGYRGKIEFIPAQNFVGYVQYSDHTRPAGWSVTSGYLPGFPDRCKADAIVNMDLRPLRWSR